MNLTSDSTYWDSFYSTWQESAPSQFAAFIAGTIYPNSNFSIIDFGCGNGRDTIFFDKYGFNVKASDRSNVAISRLEEKFKALKIEAEVAILDYGNASELDEYLTRIRKNQNDSCLFYGRFLLHAFDDGVLDIFLNSICNAAKKNDLIAFEFRTRTDDRLSGKATDTHFRRGLDIHEVLKYFKADQFQVLTCIEGFGFAVYKTDNAHVARLVLKRL
jgi:tellurite methyltransferase